VLDFGFAGSFLRSRGVLKIEIAKSIFLLGGDGISL
jgi:hypothetical protein